MFQSKDDVVFDYHNLSTNLRLLIDCAYERYYSYSVGVSIYYVVDHFFFFLEITSRFELKLRMAKKIMSPSLEILIIINSFCLKFSV